LPARRRKRRFPNRRAGFNAGGAAFHTFPATDAGLPQHCTFHGSRKASLTKLADAGSDPRRAAVLSRNLGPAARRLAKYDHRLRAKVLRGPASPVDARRSRTRRQHAAALTGASVNDAISDDVKQSAYQRRDRRCPSDIDEGGKIFPLTVFIFSVVVA